MAESATVDISSDPFAGMGEFEDVQTKAEKQIEAKDHIGRSFKEALTRYNAGQYKAAIACAADAINELAIREKIHGSASY